MPYQFGTEIERWFADTVGRCFALSAESNIDSYSFAKEFLNSSWGAGVLVEDYRFLSYTRMGVYNN